MCFCVEDDVENHGKRPTFIMRSSWGGLASPLVPLGSQDRGEASTYSKWKRPAIYFPDCAWLAIDFPDCKRQAINFPSPSGWLVVLLAICVFLAWLVVPMAVCGVIGVVGSLDFRL